MPRDDVHNATDLIRVISNEVPRRVVHTLVLQPLDPIPMDRRATAPAQVADMALRSQLTPDEQTDRQLLGSARHQTRVVAAATRARERGRFR